MSIPTRSLLRSRPQPPCHLCFRRAESTITSSPPDLWRLYPSPTIYTAKPAALPKGTGVSLAHGTTSHAPQDYVAPPNLTRRVTVKAVDIRFFDGKSLPDPAKYRDAKSLPRIFRPSDAKVPETDIPETTGIKRVDPTPIFRQRTDIPDIITAENIKSKSVNWILKPATASLTDTGHIDSESLIDNAATTNPDDWAELDTKETSLPKTKKVGRSWAGATTARRRFVDQTQESTAWAPGSEQYDDSSFRPSLTVVLKGVGSTLAEEDIRRIVPRKKHLAEFIGENDIVRVVQCRDITSLDRRPAYQLVFLTVKAAKSFAAFAINAFSNPHRSHWPAGIRFPPASRPEFVHLDQGIRRIVQQQEDISDLLYSGIEGIEGHYVLLTICGLAGRTVQTGLLPRTYQVRQILAARNVGLVEKRGVDAVARIIRERKTKDGTYRPIMADGRGTGFEARWLVRCVSESEAQRVVRDLHMTPSWEGGGLFRAEVIY